MAAALYPVFEKQITDFNPSVEVSGKALSRYSDMIDATCCELGIKTLWDFYDESPEEAEEHLGEELARRTCGASQQKPLKWFEPSEGLSTIQAPRNRLAERPATLPLKRSLRT